MTVSVDGSNGITFNDGSSQTAAASPYGLKNRIINGDMRIDQRNSGASVTATTSNLYTIDRWRAYASQSSKYTVQQNAGSVTPPAGFTNYLGVTSSSSYSSSSSDYLFITQNIEGYNVADLAWGTASAKTVTLSFWVRSSLTGTFGGALQNSAQNRSYPYTYTISAANTWEQKTITVTGDTSGTWVTNNGIGLWVNFDLGTGTTLSGTAGAWAGANYVSATGATSVVATNGATFYITGVQLEVGSTATPFERRMYGQELQLCQRYFYQLGGSAAYEFFGTGVNNTTTTAVIVTPIPVQMRTTPSLATSGSFYVKVGNTNTTVTGISLDVSGNQSLSIIATASGFTVGNGNIMFAANSTATRFQLSAEL